MEAHDANGNGSDVRPVSPSSPNTGSDGEFDDNLAVPESLSIEGPDTQDTTTNGRIPFSVVHQPIDKNRKQLNYIKDLPLTARITNYERHHTTNLINPNLYTIHLTHGPFSWTIKRRYKHFLELHNKLTFFKATLNIPFPTVAHRRRRESYRQTVHTIERQQSQANGVAADSDLPPKEQQQKVLRLPRFPKKPEMLILHEQLEDRMRHLQEYLNNLLQISIYRYHEATADFLEVSRLSFIHDLGMKRKEGLVKKKGGSTQPGQAGCNCFGCCRPGCCIKCRYLCRDVICPSFRKRWFFLKDTFFGYMDPNTGEVKSVILYDHGFEVAASMYNTGLHKAIQIQTLSRQIIFKLSSREQRKAWLDAFKSVGENEAKIFTQANINRSFAPLREHIEAAWFVDGESYMSSVADAMEEAEEEIYIADWWLSPEIYLKRPMFEGERWRLDKLLKRKAEAGVKIYVLLYKEFQYALGLNSYYSKQTLSAMHGNIQVLRHPDHAKAGVFLWAHHEKIVVVDQIYAFLGGIDLCYGRWDDHEHRLTDLGSITPHTDVSSLKKKTSSVPHGDNFYQMPLPHTMQAVIVEEPSDNESTKSDDSVDARPQLHPGDQLLMPGYRQSLRMNTPEPERKNPLTKITQITQRVKLKSKELVNMVYTQGEDEVVPAVEGDNASTRSKRQTDSEINAGAKYWIGKDYCNFIVKDFTDLDSPFTDIIDRVTTPRMPWHDIGVFTQGASARDVARHFIQRWNATKLDKARVTSSYSYLLPKSYQTIEDKPHIGSLIKHRVQCQVLRSSSSWSAGFLDPLTVEQSIHNGYVDAISKAEHFIYIENQFFISLPQGHPDTYNLIAETLFRRILRAFKSNEVFRVYVVMPLLPGFEGEVGQKTGTSLHAITHWNYASISRGEQSILQRLIKAGVEDPSKYISFYGLRNHSILNKEPITELIYVHSKLMIVDDRLIICGSANINDRSMIGKRDSEIAVMIRDEEFDEGVMNNQKYPCGRYCGSLRKHLFKEHLGLLGREHEYIDIDVADPVSESFYKYVWQDTASLNTEFYEKVFHCIPSDEVKTFADLEEYLTRRPLYTTELTRSLKMLDDIKGHLVNFPLDFLCNELLTPMLNSVEGLMPTALWT